VRLAGLAAALALAALPAGAAAQAVPIALAPGEVLLNVQAEGRHRSRPDVMPNLFQHPASSRGAVENWTLNRVQGDDWPQLG
jgi:hypothetical protein